MKHNIIKKAFFALLGEEVSVLTFHHLQKVVEQHDVVVTYANVAGESFILNNCYHYDSYGFSHLEVPDDDAIVTLKSIDFNVH